MQPAGYAETSVNRVHGVKCQKNLIFEIALKFETHSRPSVSVRVLVGVQLHCVDHTVLFDGTSGKLGCACISVQLAKCMSERETSRRGRRTCS